MVQQELNEVIEDLRFKQMEIQSSPEQDSVAVAFNAYFSTPSRVDKTFQVNLQPLAAASTTPEGFTGLPRSPQEGAGAGPDSENLARAGRWRPLLFGSRTSRRGERYER